MEKNLVVILGYFFLFLLNPCPADPGYTLSLQTV